MNSAYKEATDEALKKSLKQDMEWSSVKLKRLEYQLKKFCEATERQLDHARQQVYAIKDGTGKIIGFDKSAAQRARHIAMRHHTDWLKSIGAENSTLNTLEKYYKGKYNTSKEYQDLMLLNKNTKLLNKIKSDYNLSIHEGRQGKHIIGHNNYNGGSYLLKGINPQDIVNKYAGTGEVRRSDSGNWIRKQFFEHSDYIGVVVDNKTGKKTKTKYFSIECSKEKGTHIVPRLRK